MNLEFKGKPELIRSVEEGSRLLLSENNNNQDGSLTIILEESLDAAKASIEKKTIPAPFVSRIRFSTSVFLIMSFITAEKISLWKKILTSKSGVLCWTVPEMP